MSLPTHFTQALDQLKEWFASTGREVVTPGRDEAGWTVTPWGALGGATVAYIIITNEQSRANRIADKGIRAAHETAITTCTHDFEALGIDYETEPVKGFLVIHVYPGFEDKLFPVHVQPIDLTARRETAEPSAPSVNELLLMREGARSAADLALKRDEVERTTMLQKVRIEHLLESLRTIRDRLASL